jgi:hypothetical protein
VDTSVSEENMASIFIATLFHQDIGGKANVFEICEILNKNMAGGRASEMSGMGTT